jgi:putative flippase GtrA
MNTSVSRFLKSQFVKFCITGGLGLVTDMAVFMLLRKLLNAESRILLNIIPIFGYIVAVSQNYLINHFWTFGAQTADTSVSRKAYLSFFAVSLIALIPRYIVYNSFLSYFGSGGFYPNIANFTGIVAATLFNFIGSKYYVFKGNRK